MASIVDAQENVTTSELLLEQTLALIKPDAVARESEIEHIIVSALGFKILNVKQSHFPFYLSKVDLKLA